MQTRIPTHSFLEACGNKTIVQDFNPSLLLSFPSLSLSFFIFAHFLIQFIIFCSSFSPSSSLPSPPLHSSALHHLSILPSIPPSTTSPSPLHPPPLPLPSQHPSSPNKAILWGGNEDGPGVFPQKISGPDYNSSFVYVLDLGTGNNASWVRNLATGSPVPRPREGVHFTRDGSGVLYIYGGRTVGM